jgi:actin related protein 2/3 complex subunit 1A/1B
LRFAVASGSKCVPVCTYEHSNDWWVCKMVKKKFKSTVLCCSFHPTNGQLLATGSSDFKCRIYSTFTSDVDNTVDPGPFTHTLGPLEFGEAYVELNALGWVHAVAWSPSGNVVCYACELFFVSFVIFLVFLFLAMCCCSW